MSMLQEIISIHQRVVKNVPVDFKRYLHDNINWKHRLIGIIGARGTGKTTLVLQHYLKAYGDVEKCLYLSADNPLVLKSGIYNTVSEYFKYYGECVIIDEVHKQPEWSADIKALYDAFPDKKIIILGSSALNILHEKGDLSRRILLHRLKGLSFREYLNFKYNLTLEPVVFDDLLKNHIKVSGAIPSDIKVLAEFKKYCSCGCYPFFKGLDEGEYYSFLSNIIGKIVYEDIPSIKSIVPASCVKIKKLLAFLCVSKIPLFNISSLTNEIDVSKDSLYDYFDLLERAEVLNIVRPADKNLRTLKNSKILFSNPIAASFWENDADKGNVRESFAASQLKDIVSLNASKILDFTIIYKKRKYELEVGGKNKDKKQLGNLENGYILKDGIEYGSRNVLPLYLLGFLY